MTASLPRVGLIGLGGMGRGIGQNLLKAGYPLSVFDIRPEAVRVLADQGARGCASPSEVGQHSDVVLLIPLTYEQVRSIVLEDGLLDALAPGATIVVMATVAPAQVKDLAHIVAARGPGAGRTGQRRAVGRRAGDADRDGGRAR